MAEGNKLESIRYKDGSLHVLNQVTGRFPFLLFPTCSFPFFFAHLGFRRGISFSWFTFLILAVPSNVHEIVQQGQSSFSLHFFLFSSPCSRYRVLIRCSYYVPAFPQVSPSIPHRLHHLPTYPSVIHLFFRSVQRHASLYSLHLSSHAHSSVTHSRSSSVILFAWLRLSCRLRFLSSCLLVLSCPSSSLASFDALPPFPVCSSSLRLGRLENIFSSFPLLLRSAHRRASFLYARHRHCLFTPSCLLPSLCFLIAVTLSQANPSFRWHTHRLAAEAPFGDRLRRV